MSLPNTPLNYQGGIIDMGAYNGRVDLVSAPGPEVRNKMYQKAWIDNRSTKYDCPVEGIWENHLITRTFFSKENIQIIQNGIRAGVYKRSGERKLVVPPQNTDTLKIIMHSILLQYASLIKPTQFFLLNAFLIPNFSNLSALTIVISLG
jgi:hypothetical protein